MNDEHFEMQSGGGPAGALPFIYGHVDPTLFPIDQMRAAADEALHRFGTSALNYGVESGCSRLLEFLQAKFALEEDIRVGADSLMLTVGASGALDTICRLFTRPGDTVLVEAPSYHEALAMIRDYPVRIASVPTDDDGLIVEALADRLKQLAAQGVRTPLLYIVPSYQNPSGVTLSAERRPALLELARQYGLLTVEDDVYRDLSYEDKPPPSLFALDVLDEGQTALRLGSFSKILAPGLRLGWLMAPPAIVDQIIRSGLCSSGGGANPLSAYATAIFCEKGWLEPHIARLVEVYRRRRDVLLQALETTMPKDVRWTYPRGGFFVWLTLPGSLRARDVLKEAHRHSITFLTGEPFFAEGGGEHHIRLPFSYIPPEEMAEGIETLAQIINHLQ